MCLNNLKEKKADSLVSFDGKDHISASRAAKITGYHPDYVGQLARSGAIISRQVGNRWYIDREGILAHKQEKDSLLGAVQAQSVGIARSTNISAIDTPKSDYSGPGPFLTYTRDDNDLLPNLEKLKPLSADRENQVYDIPERTSVEVHPGPIRTMRPAVTNPSATYKKHEMHPSGRVRVPGRAIFQSTFRNLATVALTVVIVLSFGFVTLRNSSVYGQGRLKIQNTVMTANASGTFQWLRDTLRDWLGKDLTYKRENW